MIELTREEFIEKTTREGWNEEYVQDMLDHALKFEVDYGLPYSYEAVLPIIDDNLETAYNDRSVCMD